jgi:glucosylceramidase
MMSESRRKKRYFVLPMVILLAAGMTWSTPAVQGAAAAAGRAQFDRVDGSAVAAHAWVTTADGQLEFSDQGTVPFTTAKPDQLTISVDPSRTFQTMQGFGASLTDSSAAVLYRLDKPARDAAMVQLFDPQRGDGLSYLRQVIGSSDFVATSSHYTYDDLPAGGTDYEMRRFSIAHDQIQILPLLRQARALNPQLQILGSPWSPPAWMKTNGSLVGGSLIDDPRIYRAYALYFVKFIQAYQRAGVPVNTVTVQNEPQNRNPNGYPGMYMSAEQQAAFIKVLGPALQAAHLSTKILAYDHNWSMHPGDIASTPPGQTPETEYPTLVLSDPEAARWISGVAYHCYYGDPSRQTTLHQQFPNQAIFFTECSGSHGASDTPAQTFRGTLTWHARNLTIGTTRNWAQTVITFNLALDQSGGPHLGGCGLCTGVITVGPGQKVTTNAEYYTLGHLSRFVKPGAVRIASTSFGTTGWNGQIMDVAFRNPDGSTALVVHNENDLARSFAVSVGGRSFDYTLPGGALATFTWPASRSLDDRSRQLDPQSMTASAQPPGSIDPCCSADVAANAVDDDATTRWTTGTGQQTGQYLQVDLGRRQHFSSLILDTGASTGDYPRGYAVYVSQDGRHWDGPVATGVGTGQLTDIAVPGHSARYLRIMSTASSPSWWSVADLRVYQRSDERVDTG